MAGAEGKSIFVIGAGASREFGLPTGRELKDQIAAHLSKAHVDAGVITPENVLGIALVEAGLQNDIPDVYMSRAASLVARAMPQVLSIDNFLYQHRGDRSVELCGKLAIVKSILDAESSSLLASDVRSQMFGACPFALKRVEDLWANRLVQILFSGCAAGDLEERFKRIGFVVFNYDRCVEHFIFHSLQNVYGHLMTAERAAELVSSLEIHHPYGSVGPLDVLARSDEPSATRFGAKLGTVGLRERVDTIKTFSESTATSDVSAIQEAVHGSSKLVFLGFSFAEQNLELLFGPRRQKDIYAPCLGTCFEMSGPNVKMVKESLGRRGLRGDISFADLRCGDFIDQYSGVLRFD